MLLTMLLFSEAKVSFFDAKYLKFSWKLAEITERRSDIVSPQNISSCGGLISERSPDEQLVITNKISGGSILDIDRSVQRILAAQ
jgi:hypothetical protein